MKQRYGYSWCTGMRPAFLEHVEERGQSGFSGLRPLVDRVPTNTSASQMTAISPQVITGIANPLQMRPIVKK